MAANTDKLRKATPGFSAQLTAGIASGDTTIPISGLGALPTLTAVTLVIDPDITLGKKEVITGVVSGSNLINCVRAVEGGAIAHANGAVVVDYYTAAHWNSMVDWGLAQHNQDGSHATNMTATTPLITGGIKDTNGNPIVTLSPVASAVNQITVADAAAAGAPSIAATGNDTNIDLKLLSKGTGLLQLFGFNGWQPGFSTWTYVSATTFTVPAADAALMQIGTKIWLTQTTSKYFYVVGISGTTITVTAGSDYTLANAAITAPFFSNVASPPGFPHWFNFSPTYTGFSVNPSGNTCRFNIVGRQVSMLHFKANGTSNAATLAISLPVACNATYGYRSANMQAIDNGNPKTAPGEYDIPAGSTVVNCYSDCTGAPWTTTGQKTANGMINYEI
jgi:hypothetical protein